MEVPRPAGLQLSRFTSDVDPPSSPDVIHQCGILHAGHSTRQINPVNYWLPDVNTYGSIVDWLQVAKGFDLFVFTPFSNSTNWISSHGSTEPISKIFDAATFAKEAADHAIAALHRDRPTGAAAAATAAATTLPQQQDPPPADDLMMSPPNVQRQHGNLVPPTQQRTQPQKQQQNFNEENVARRVLDILRAEMGSQNPPFRNHPPPPPPRPQQDATTGAQANATPRGAIPQAQGNAVPQQGAPQGGPAQDPNTVLLQSVLHLLAAKEKPSKATIEFSKWDGDDETKRQFIQRLKTVQQDPWFSGASWDVKSPNFETQSLWLRHGILGALPKDWLDNFDEKDHFVTDGFAMFTHLLHLLQPTSTDSVIQMVMDLASG